MALYKDKNKFAYVGWHIKSFWMLVCHARLYIVYAFVWMAFYLCSCLVPCFSLDTVWASFLHVTVNAAARRTACKIIVSEIASHVGCVLLGGSNKRTQQNPMWDINSFYHVNFASLVCFKKAPKRLSFFFCFMCICVFDSALITATVTFTSNICIAHIGLNVSHILWCTLLYVAFNEQINTNWIFTTNQLICFGCDGKALKVFIKLWNICRWSLTCKCVVREQKRGKFDVIHYWRTDVLVNNWESD